MKRLVTTLAASLLLLGSTPIAQAADTSTKPTILDLIHQYSDAQLKLDLAGRNPKDNKAAAPVDWTQLTPAVKQLIAEGASVNGEPDGHRTPLMQAVFTHQDDLVELLLKSGAKANAKDDRGETALMFASYNARPAVVRMLLQHGADVNARSTDDQQHSPLDQFITNPEHDDAVQGQVECIRLLVAAGAKLKVGYGEQGLTPLMIAAMRNKPEVVTALIELGADVHAVDRTGGNALAYAAQSGRSDVVKALLAKGARADIRTKDLGWTPLLAAIESGDEETALLLLEHSKPATINMRSTPIPYHANGGYKTALVDAIEKDMLALIPKLLAKGANINAPGDERGLTPLSSAASQHKEEIVQLLLNKGAKVDAPNEDGDTPLMYVAGYGPNPEMVELLIKRGAKVNAKNRQGETALDKARQSSTGEENASVLRKHGAAAGTGKTACCGSGCCEKTGTSH